MAAPVHPREIKPYMDLEEIKDALDKLVDWARDMEAANTATSATIDGYVSNNNG